MDVTDPGIDDKCARKGAVVAEFLAEECGDGEFVVQEIPIGGTSMFVYVPRGLSMQAEEMASSPIGEDEFVEMLQESPWLAPWLGGVCDFAGVDPDNDQQLRQCISNFGGEALNEAVEVNDRATDIVASEI